MMKSTTEPMDASLQFCPNEACSARGQIGGGTIIIHSRKRPRYRCQICKKTFSARTGTMFARTEDRRRENHASRHASLPWLSTASDCACIWTRRTNRGSLATASRSAVPASSHGTRRAGPGQEPASASRRPSEPKAERSSSGSP